MRFTTVVLKNILRRPVRSVLTISGVAVAVGAVVALVGVANDFEKSLLGIYEAHGVDLVVVRAGSVERFSSRLPEGLGERIRGLPNVSEVWPLLIEVVSFEKNDLFGVAVQGLLVDSRFFRELHLVDGRPIEPGDGRVVLLGKILARNLNTNVGDTLEVIPGEPYRVVGIYTSYNVFEDSSVAMTLGELQRSMDRQDEVTYFTVVAEQKDAESLEKLRREINGLASSLETLPTRQYVDTSVEIRIARALAWLTSTIALVIGAIGMVNTMLTSVFERTGELALLRAIGWTKRRVVRLILLESLALGTAGAVVGSAAAIALTKLLAMLPASDRMVSGDIGAKVVLQGFAVAILVGLVGGLYPAWRAAQLMPTEGLRHG